MPRRRKSLVDLVRDGTFLARKDEHLLRRRDPLPWPELEAVRQLALVVDDKVGLRELALDVERRLRFEDGAAHYFGRLQDWLLSLGPRDSFQQLENFFATALVHQAGPKAGQPFTFDPFQDAFLREFWRRDRHGRRIYNVGLWGIPKGSGKSPVTGGLGDHATVSETDAPEVYAVAGSRDQAGNVHDFAGGNILRPPNLPVGVLAAWMDVGGSTIHCPEHGGTFEVLSSDGDLAAGVNPSAAIGDELWLFRHRAQREAITSLTKALHKRAGRSWFLGITTAGYDKATLLGEMYDRAMQHPKVEVLNGGFLRVLRDPDSGFLMHWYGVPDGMAVDIENPEIVRACNPASWVDVDDLLRELRRPDTLENDWIRLHLNGWTAAKDALFPSGTWAGLRSEAWVPEGADIFVAIDAAHSYDTTAVVWAARLEDGRIALRCRVWSVRPEVAHHVFVAGGRMQNALIEDFIADDLAETYNVREIVGDPRFLNEVLPRLAGRLRSAQVAEYMQNGKEMGDAYQHFYESVHAGTVAWEDEEGVFARHVDAAAAVMTRSGIRADKLKASEPMDCVPAASMARERCAVAARKPKVAEPWAAVWS